MSNYDITFSDLKKLSSSIEKKDNTVICNYLNNFKGDNIWEKFRNFLVIWENDVSSNITLNLNNKNTNIDIIYLLSEIPETIEYTDFLESNSIEIKLSIPKNFTKNDDIFPIYDIIHSLKLSNIEIDMTILPDEDKKSVVDNLPPSVYNDILNKIIEKGKILRFSNPMLKDIRFNFYTNEPFAFLQGLFSNYTSNYFMDVIYHLSKKIDSQILFSSTLKEVEYYIQKFNDEVKEQRDQQGIA
jgi:hypothetical protein